MTPRWLLNAWDEALEENSERSLPRKLLPLKGFRVPKGGRWLLEVARFKSPVPAAPLLSLAALVAMTIVPLAHLLWFTPMLGMALTQFERVLQDDNLPVSYPKIDGNYQLTPINGSTYNFGWYYNKVGGVKEVALSAYIAIAAADGATAIWIPKTLTSPGGTSIPGLPYTVSLVTNLAAFSAAGGRLIREGGNPTVCDVQAYGATGDNSADDSVAINAAAVAAANDILYFPNTTVGKYKVTTAILVQTNTVVVMEAGASVVQFTESQSVFSVVNKANVKLRDLVVDYNTTNVRQVEGAIQVTDSTNFEIIACRVVKAAGMGIYTGNNSRGRILSNIVENTLADGIHVANGGTGSQVSRDITIVNNVCNNTGDDSISVIGYTTSAVPNDSVTIAGNVIDTCAARGITVAGSKYVTISANTIRNTVGPAGINVMLDDVAGTYAAEEVVVANNTIEPASGASASTRHGINVYRSHRVTVIGNMVDWQAGEGIMVYGKTDGTDPALDNTVIGNLVRGTTTGEQGIHLQRANNCGVRQNTIVQAAKSGIFVEICNNTLIDGNFLDESNQQAVNATNLLTVSGGDTATITNNIIKQTSGTFTHGITITSQTGETRHWGNVFQLTGATRLGVLINVSSANLNPSLSADRGDASVTLVVGTDAESQRFATAFTADRTVALSTTNATHGSKFRITRTGGDTNGPWSLGVLSRNLLTNQWVDVQYDAASAAWREVAYGELQPPAPLTVPFSATPTFPVSRASRFEMTLTSNVTGMTIGSGFVGQRITLTFIQDGTGGRAVAGFGSGTIKISWSDTGNTLGKRSSVSAIWDGTNWNQDGAQAPYV